MPAYSIEFVKSAQKEFERLPIKIRTKIAEALGFLAQNPFSDLLKVKKLKGAEDVYRFRTGDYRVLYEVHRKRLVILVIKVGNRKEVYRR
ncbi:MAG: type II toxin-antitoxin system RelE/ParE family toxin [Acidobacteria bacterium]|nr:type II toxin-antitoxin system RelE/ParE family toxin [Acidobacteriota bacterium]